jgi:competence protein ComEA
MFELTVRQRIAALVLLVFLGIGGFLLFINRNGHYSEIYNTSAPPAKIYVHVCGAVAKPGVISLKPGTRKFEILNLAGGTLPDADLSQVNLAQYALDGEQIYFPRKGETIKSRKVSKNTRNQESPSQNPVVLKSKVNWPLEVNNATVTELDTVPGIGPGLADKIIQYRTKHGRFQKYEDLLKVNGIGNAKLEKFRPFLCVK